MNHHAANMTTNKQPLIRSHDAAVVDILRADPDFANEYLAAALEEADERVPWNGVAGGGVKNGIHACNCLSVESASDYSGIGCSPRRSQRKKPEPHTEGRGSGEAWPKWKGRYLRPGRSRQPMERH